MSAWIFHSSSTFLSWCGSPWLSVHMNVIVEFWFLTLCFWRSIYEKPKYFWKQNILSFVLNALKSFNFCLFTLFARLFFFLFPKFFFFCTWNIRFRTLNEYCPIPTYFSLHPKKEKESAGSWIRRCIWNVIGWCTHPAEFENISLFCITFLFSYIFLLMHILFLFSGSVGRWFLQRYGNAVLQIYLNCTMYACNSMILHLYEYTLENHISFRLVTLPSVLFHS